MGLETPERSNLNVGPKIIDLISDQLVELGFDLLSNVTKTFDFPIASFNVQGSSILGRYDRRHFSISLKWEWGDEQQRRVAENRPNTVVKLAIFHNYRLPGTKAEEFHNSRRVSEIEYDLFEPGSLESLIDNLQKSEDMSVAGHRLVYDFYRLE
jgi:hypothetical protein